MSLRPSSVPRRLRPVLTSLILALTASLAVPALASACSDADIIPTSRTISKARAATLCLLNEQRAAHGLRKLRPHSALERAAQRYAHAMVRGRFFGHVSPSGSTLEERIRRGTRYLAGALRYQIGENIGWGVRGLARPRAIVNAWMASPGHRANILSRAFREVGIGIKPGAPVRGVGRGAVTYTNEFGARA